MGGHVLNLMRAVVVFWFAFFATMTPAFASRDVPASAHHAVLSTLSERHHHDDLIEPGELEPAEAEEADGSSSAMPLTFTSRAGVLALQFGITRTVSSLTRSSGATWYQDGHRKRRFCAPEGQRGPPVEGLTFPPR
jgi:hypothetical protein